MVKVVVSFIVFGLSAIGGKLAFDAFLNDPEVASYEESKWRNREHMGITFESPFELSNADSDIPKFIKPFVKYMYVYKHDCKALCLAISKAEYVEDIQTDIDGAAKGIMISIRANEDVADLTYEIVPISKYYLEGRRITGKFKMKGKNSVITAELYKSGSMLIQILWTCLDYPENCETGERIMQSMNVQI